MNLKKMSERSKTAKTILYDYTYFKFLEKAKLYRQEADQWLPGVRGSSTE